MITSAELKIKKQGLVGNDPFVTHKPLIVDIRKPYFGSSVTLIESDFQAPANKESIGVFDPIPKGGWYSATLMDTAYPYINLTGPTQFRLRFLLDDDDDNIDDYFEFVSGNSTTVPDRPVLIIHYTFP